jgi:streptomycin 6-kinase
LRLDASLPGGTEALVLRVTTATGNAAVLKIMPPWSETNRSEIRTLELARGQGYARLLRHDETRTAFLLEALGSPLAEQGYAVDRQIELMCQTLQQAWMPLPSNDGFMNGAEKAVQLEHLLLELAPRFAEQCSPFVLKTALSYARQRHAAYRAEQSVLAHGDANPWNALLEPHTQRFKLIDPDGLWIEPEYDLGVLMREWLEAYLEQPWEAGQRRCRNIAACTNADPTAIWQWGFLEITTTALYLCQLNHASQAETYFAVLESWVRALE